MIGRTSAGAILVITTGWYFVLLPVAVIFACSGEDAQKETAGMATAIHAKRVSLRNVCQRRWLLFEECFVQLIGCCSSLCGRYFPLPNDFGG